MKTTTLPPRQEQALTLRARGYLIAECAQEMQCSIANINNLLRETYHKLYARGTADAIAKAMQQGLIKLLIVVAISAGCNPGDKPIRPQRCRQTPRITRISRANRKEEIA